MCSYTYLISLMLISDCRQSTKNNHNFKIYSVAADIQDMSYAVAHILAASRSCSSEKCWAVFYCPKSVPVSVVSTLLMSTVWLSSTCWLSKCQLPPSRSVSAGHPHLAALSHTHFQCCTFFLFNLFHNILKIYFRYTFHPARAAF